MGVGYGDAQGDDGEYADTWLSGVHSGSTGGAAIGSSFMPGVGTAIGAAAGAVGGLFTGWRKAEREKKAKQARERAWKEAQAQLAADRYRMNRQADAAFRGGYTPANNSLGKMYGEDANLDLSKSPLTYLPGRAFDDYYTPDARRKDATPEDEARWRLWQSGQITDAEYFGSQEAADKWRADKKMYESKPAQKQSPSKSSGGQKPGKKGGGGSKSGKKPVTYQP